MSRSLVRDARTDSRFRSPSPGVLVVIAAFVTVRIAYWVTGGGFSTTALRDSWQLLDLHQLVAHPFQNVWLLHTQPPLFNLFVGTTLRWSPLSSALTFQIVYFLLALTLVVALRALLVELGFAAFAATAGAVAVACEPGLLSYENAIIYELPVAALLVVSGLLCARDARTRRARTLTALVIVMTVIVMTRALLHPVWLGAMIALIVIAVRPRLGVLRTAAIVAIPVFVVGGWIVKNQVEFGEPNLSSWLGMNLARGVIAPMPKQDIEQLIRQGTLSRAARVPAFSPYSAYVPTVGRCQTDRTEPVLRSLRKQNGQSNFDAVCFLRVYREGQRNAFAAIRERPGAYLAGRRPSATAHFWFELGPGLEPFRDNPVLRGLKRVYDVPMLSVSVAIHDRDWTNRLIPSDPSPAIPLSITLVLATAFVLGRAAFGAVRLVRRRARTGDLAWTYLGCTVAFVTIVSIATEYGENSRFRFLVDPILIGALVAAVVDGATRLRSRRSPEVVSAAPTTAADPS